MRKGKPETPVASAVSCEINPAVLYSLDEIKRRSGFGSHAMRIARRNGLRVLYTSGTAFVLGQHFIDYILANSEVVHAGQAATPE